MKIEFEDRSYAECYKSNHPGKIVLVISAQDYNDKLKRITNSCEMTMEEFKKLIEGIV